ncbi:MAG: hypothetical protein WCG78_06210, partial [Candidatus Omnitrophota bacterium]
MKSPRKVIASLFVTPISLFLIIGGFSAGFCPVAQAAGSGQRTADHITITADLTRYLRAAAAGERPAQIILNRITQALASIPKNKDGSPIDPAWFAEQLKKALPDLHLRPVERTSGVYEGVPYLELTSIAFDRETGNYIVHIDTDTAMGATFTIHKNTVTSLLDKQGRRRGNGSTLYSGHRLRNWPRGHGGSRGAHSRLATDEPFQTLELRPLLSGAAGLDVFMPDHQTGELVEVGTPAAVPYHISTNTNARIPQDQTAYAVLGDKAYAITDTSITPLDETIDALARDQVARAEGEATVSTVPITGYFTHLTKNGGNLTLSTPTGNAPFTFPINQGRVYQAAQVEGLVLDNTCVTQLPNGSTVISIYTGQTMKGSGQDSNYFYSSFIILLDGSVYSQGNLNLSQAVKAANNPTMENLANRTQLRAPTVTLPDGVTTITKNGVNFTFSSSAPTNGYVLTPRALYGTQRAAYDATVVNDASFSASTVRAASPTVSVLAIHTNYLFQQYYSQHWFALFAIGTDGSVTYLGDASGYITITDALDQGVARVNNPTSADLALRFPMRPADPSSTITIDTHMTATKLLGAEMITISRLAGENFSFSTA